MSRRISAFNLASLSPPPLPVGTVSCLAGRTARPLPGPAFPFSKLAMSNAMGKPFAIQSRSASSPPTGGACFECVT